MWSKCLTFCSEMPPFQSKSFGDVFITFRSPKVLPTSTQPVVECSYFRRPARVHHIQNTACGFSLHLEIGCSSASLCKCPPECILAALPSSSSPVDPEAEDCHCHELKGCGGVITQPLQLSPQQECHSHHVLLLQALLFWAKKRFTEYLHTSTKLYNSGQSLWFSQSGS